MHLPRKASYRLVSPVGAVGAHTTRKSVGVVEWMQAATGYVHSCSVIVLGCCLLLSLAPTWREWRWGSHAALNFTDHAAAATGAQNGRGGVGSAAANAVTVSAAFNGATAAGAVATPRWWLESPTSWGMSVLFVCSIAYFLLQIAALQYRGRFHTSKRQRILLHHVLSIVGLAACVATGRDGPLALVGFVLAESSNPPYFVLQLCKYATKTSWRNGPVRSSSSGNTGRVLRFMLRPLIYLCLSMDLSLLHVLTFLLTRLMALQFTAHAVMPFASLLTTKICATSLTLLSAVQFLDHLPALQDGPSSSSSTTGGLRAERANIVSELREMQECCYEDYPSAASQISDEDSNSRTSRRHPSASSRSNGGSGSGGSPRSAAVAPASDCAASEAALAKRPPSKKKLLWS